jgi:fibronectin-binding autotransporter adhesin
MTTSLATPSVTSIASAAALVATLWVVPAQAGIVTLGDVNPNPGSGTVAGVLTVGTNSMGSVTVNGGSSLQAGNLGIANNGLAGNGKVLVSGAGSQLRVTHASPGSMNVGGIGTGRLEVLDGASFQFDALLSVCSSGCSTFVSNGAGSTGEMLVSGAGSSFASRTSVVVGHKSVFTQATDGLNYGTVGGISHGTARVDSGGTGRSAFLVVGSPGGGNGRTLAEQAFGTVTVDGVGSSWTLTREAASVGGLAALSISNGAQTSGVVDITHGGRMRIDGTASPGDFFGANVATGASNSQGTLRVDGAGSRLEMTGGMGFINLGIGSGSIATMQVTNGGVVEGFGQSGLPFLNVGRRGATGTLTVSGNDAAGNASALRLNGRNTVTDGGAFMNVGLRENNLPATGTVNVLAGGQLDIDTRGLVLTNGNGQPGMYVGFGDGSRATLNITGTSTLTGAASRLGIYGDSGVNPYVAVGRDGATGNMLVSAGGRFVMESSHVSVSPTYANGDGMFFEIGRRFAAGNDASVGTVTVTGAGSSFEMLGSSDRYIQVGLGVNSNGTLNVQNGGLVRTVSMLVGNGPSSVGTVNLDGGTLQLGGVVNAGASPGQGGSFSLGRDGGVGIANLNHGAALLLNSATARPTLNIGGTGTAPGGTGTMFVEGGSTATASGPQARVNVGARASATAAGIGTLVINGAGSSVSALGSGAAVLIGATSNTVGTVVVGNGGALTTNGLIGIAHNGVANTGGTGVLIVNGTATANSIDIGSAGLLGGSGLIIGQVNNHGTVSPGNSPGRLTINGGFDSNDGKIILEVERLAGGGFAVDEIVFGDPMNVFMGKAQIEFSFLGDTNPEEFRSSGLFDLKSFFKEVGAGGAVEPLSDAHISWFSDALFAARADAYRFNSFAFVPGQGATFDISQIPTPASVPLVALALLVLSLSRQRKIAKR